MLVQDGLTGYLHEVPDAQLYGYDEVYDHLGNPVGLFPALAALASKVLPGVASAVMPAASSLISKVLPGITGAAGILPAVAGALAPPGGMPGLPALPFPGLPGAGGFPLPMPPPVPGGWMRPPMPYMGMRPRRVYLRCGMWPGEPGLVPMFAANMPGAPALPGAVPPAVAVATAAPAAPRRIIRRRRW